MSNPTAWAQRHRARLVASDWSTSPTAIRRGFASSRTILSTSPMKAAATRSTSLAEYGGSRARCDHERDPQ